MHTRAHARERETREDKFSFHGGCCSSRWLIATTRTRTNLFHHVPHGLAWPGKNGNRPKEPLATNDFFCARMWNGKHSWRKEGVKNAARSRNGLREVFFYFFRGVLEGRNMTITAVGSAIPAQTCQRRKIRLKLCFISVLDHSVYSFLQIFLSWPGAMYRAPFQLETPTAADSKTSSSRAHVLVWLRGTIRIQCAGPFNPAPSFNPPQSSA